MATLVNDAAHESGSQTASGVPCMACGGGNLMVPFPRRLPWVSRCGGCGLAFANPQPTDEELAEIYDASYFETFGFTTDNSAAYRAMKQASAARLLSHVERYVHPGRLLDVGSALGDLRFVAVGRGWTSCGIEPNPFAVEAADELLSESTFGGTFEEFDFPRCSFDLIACTDVLEHLRRPDESLRRMFDLLRPGGCLMLTTINVDGWQSRLFRSRWVHYHRDHLWYFNQGALCRLAAEAGFEIAECRTARKVFNLRYILEIFSAQQNSSVMNFGARLALKLLSDRQTARALPALPEGLLLIARKPGEGP